MDGQRVKADGIVHPHSERRPGAVYPAASRSWCLVALLVLAYALSFVDRQILSLLVDDLKRSLSLTDAQIGLLQGPAFGLFYALLGLPLGMMADRLHRMRLIAAGLLLWTVMTILCGLADSYPLLFLFRMGVGVGEAALVPAAVSLLADAFPPERRALPLATFTAGISVGAGLALMLGGALVTLARGGVADLPLIGPWLAGREAWQVVLILAGLAGIPIGLLCLCIPEPARQDQRGTESFPGETFALIPWIRTYSGIFAPLLAGTTLLYLFSNAFSSWMPALFVRSHGWTPAMVGLRLGVIILLCGLVGNILSGTVATTLIRRGRATGALETMMIGALILLPAALVGPLAQDVALAQVAVMAVYLGLALCFGVATASIVAVTPGALRGRMVALYLLLGNLIGLGLGPPSVGFMLDRLFGRPDRVGPALALVGCATVLPGLLLLWRARGPYARRAGTLAERP